MELLQYIMIETNYTVNGVKYTSYGIAIADFSDTYPVIIETIPSLSTQKEPICRLTELCNQLRLSPMHLADVVEDFLAE